MAAVDVFYQAQHHLFQKTYLDFNIETCYLLSLAVRTTERNNQENEKYKTRQRLLKEKFIPRWQDFLLLAKKKIIQRWVTHRNFDLQRAFQPYEILI